MTAASALTDYKHQIEQNFPKHIYNIGAEKTAPEKMSDSTREMHIVQFVNYFNKIFTRREMKMDREQQFEKPSDSHKQWLEDVDSDGEEAVTILTNKRRKVEKK